MTTKTPRLLTVDEDVSRLEIDTQKFDEKTRSEEHEINIRDMTVAVQCLPLAVGETIELTVTDSVHQPTSWYVSRKNELTYRFLCREFPVCGDFIVGDVDDEEAVRTKLGWYDIRLDREPRLKGTPLEHYVWMGDEMSTHIGGMLVLFYLSVDRLRLYPFVSNPTTDPKKIKNPSKRKKAQAQTNVIVYLGRPPGNPPKEPSGENQPREFGYPRRQHRRTLRAERFKNHPKYGVYKGVLVQQSWCGPKTYVHRKKIYRLWEPPEIDVAG